MTSDVALKIEQRLDKRPVTGIYARLPALLCPALALRLLPTAYALPLARRDDAPAQVNIVSNFQDLSAVLSLLASDSVETKLTNPRAADWERMSTFWSLFGIIGVVRAYAKISAGLAGAEAAGIDLCGGGVYTSRRTAGALSTWEVGAPANAPHSWWWQDLQNQLLGAADSARSPWQRPHVVVIGYGQCPFSGRQAVREVRGLLVWATITAMISCAPTVILRQSVRGNFYENVALGTSAGAALVGGCVLPLLMQRCNTTGVALLRNLVHNETGSAISADVDYTGEKDAVGPAPIIVADGDTVITSTEQSLSMLMWQSPGAHPWSRSGDLLYVRALAAVSTAAVLVFYIFNYIILGAAASNRAYAWLGAQVGVLVLRYCLWAVRPQLTASRPMSMLYLIVGSIGEPLQPDDRSEEASGGVLTRDVVKFAVASASSKVHNGGGEASKINGKTLAALADTAPADILRANYCSLAAIVKTAGPPVHAIRLPWSFMEEVYAAQGLILGNNPWALGGLYLAAVLRSGQFVGLTSIHPVGAETNQTHGEDALYAGANGVKVVGVTSDNFDVGGSLVDGIILGPRAMRRREALSEWHTKFQENVAKCRAAAVSNGPTHCEVHAQNYGEGQSGRKRMARTEAAVGDALRYIADVVDKERNKDHSLCGEHCTIFTF